MPDLWSVSELNRYVKQSLEMDYRLQDLRVAGEVSGFRAYPSGHWYFTLKDGGAQVSCVMWRGRAERQRFTPRDGDAVIAAGAVSLVEVIIAPTPVQGQDAPPQIVAALKAAAAVAPDVIILARGGGALEDLWC